MRADVTAPRFEIGASRRADEEAYSSSSETPDQDSEDEKGEKGENAGVRTQRAAETSSPVQEEETSGTQIDVVA